MTGTGERSILHAGTFDVRNYGDLLFPLLAEMRLAPHGFRLRPASPTGRSTGWRDAVASEPIIPALYGVNRPDGILIGGGNIIHMRPVTLPDYADQADWAYGALWVDAGLVAQRAGIPLAWNAPGVPHGFSEQETPALNAALAAASYLSVRDEASADALQGAARVVPDTALDLARLWPKPSLADAFGTLIARTGADGTQGFAALHIKERSVAGAVEHLAPLIDAFADRTGLVPILIGIGACHGDDVATTRVSKAMVRPHVNLAEPLGLREIASAIAYSRQYVGASMHGYVTAAAYGRSGIIVARPRLPKMAGVLAHLCRPQDEALDWADALDRAATGPALETTLPDTVTAALDEHWGAVVSVLSGAAKP
jgi:polysaccharide pyruvyl transferase WcaK-like protein